MISKAEWGASGAGEAVMERLFSPSLLSLSLFLSFSLSLCLSLSSSAAAAGSVCSHWPVARPVRLTWARCARVTTPGKRCSWTASRVRRRGASPRRCSAAASVTWSTAVMTRTASSRTSMDTCGGWGEGSLWLCAEVELSLGSGGDQTACCSVRQQPTCFRSRLVSAFLSGLAQLDTSGSLRNHLACGVSAQWGMWMLCCFMSDNNSGTVSGLIKNVQTTNR